MNNTDVADKDKYVKLKHVQELIRLFEARDSVYDWSDVYKRYNNKVKSTIEWLERNAKEID